MFIFVLTLKIKTSGDIFVEKCQGLILKNILYDQIQNQIYIAVEIVGQVVYCYIIHVLYYFYILNKDDHLDYYFTVYKRESQEIVFVLFIITCTI